MKTNDFISCDIETLGTQVNSSIIQIGLCAYINGEYITTSELIKPDFDRADADTLAWWRKQPHQFELFAAAGRDGAPTVSKAWDKIIATLGMSIDELKALQWWFRGPHFDEAMLNHQGPALWEFYNVRDQRTLQKTIADVGLSPDVFVDNDFKGQKHDAGFDAEMQARVVVSCKASLTYLVTDEVLINAIAMGSAAWLIEPLTTDRLFEL